MDNDRQTIEDVKARIDIVNLVDKHVKLRQTGKNYVGLCPFHDEKTPSFHVSPDLQRYKCFGCDKSGDALTFVQEIENIEFYDALKKLAKEAGVEIKSSGQPSKHAWIEELNSFATDFFHTQLTSVQGKEALAYLKKRGINKEAIKTFKIGYAPSFNALQKAVAQRYGSKYTPKQLEDSGLFVKKDKGIRDKFIDRVMFPIWSVSGRVVGFSGRQTPKNTFGPKYLNTAATPLFYKSSVLLGIYQAKNAMRKEDLCVLCEGNLDVISAYQIGITHAIAPMGTAITQQQIELIARYTKNILILFDSDKAGQQAVERAFKITTALGIDAYAATPEPYQDLDELIQKDEKLAKEKVKPTMDAFSYLLTAKMSGLDLTSLQGHKQLVNYVNNLLTDVKDKSTKQFYLGKASTLTKIDFGGRSSMIKNVPTKTPMISKKPQIDRAEQSFISLLVTNKLFANAKKLRVSYFSTPEIKEILQLIADEEVTSADELLQHGKLSQEAKEVLQEAIFLADSNQSTIDPKEELNQIYIKIKDIYLDNRIKRVSSQLAIAEEKEDEEEITRLLQLSDKLRLQKKSQTS